MLVQRPDPQQPSPTLRPGDGDRVAYAAIRQPAVVAAVQTHPPRSVQLARRRHHRALVHTLLPALLQGQLVGDQRVEDLPCMGKEGRLVQRLGCWISQPEGSGFNCQCLKSTCQHP